MQKLFLPLLFIIAFITQGNAQQRLFDQPVQLKSCNISIEANPFIATTVIEMEFYNPKDQEVEGLHSFQLNRGQVITDFQLELNGKYREGSIEERWKARQAYNSIVGKRIDPAILQMNWDNYYSINIYPIAAKSSRKVKFTITQMMVEENRRLSYTLPLNIKGATENFSLDIKISKPASIPYANEGLLKDQLFSMHSDEATFSQYKNDISLNEPVSFSISQFVNKPQFCISNKNGVNNFIMRFYPEVERYYPNKAKTINVYWDVSLSGKERNLARELDYLEKYIADNEIIKTTIFLFNDQMQGVFVHFRDKDSFSLVRNYLLNYKYSGATELGMLDFSNVIADAVLVFSDGVNSIGKAKPKPGPVPVNCVSSSYYYYNSYNGYYYSPYTSNYDNIIGNSGGSIIRLYNKDLTGNVKRTDLAENFLFKYNSANIHFNESFPVSLGGSVLLSGTIKQSDNLEFLYGNNSVVNRSENYFIPVTENCDETTYKKMQMLKAYDSLMYGSNRYFYWNWQDMIVFGLSERVVTPQTSFLVLERIEDYIKYKIAPPKELEQKCAEMNYVYSSEYKIKTLKTFTEQEMLESVIKSYNKRVSWWDKNETLIDLNRVLPEKQNIAVATAGSNAVAGKPAEVSIPNTFMQGGGGDIKEVVVTTAYQVKRSLRSQTSNVQNITQEQLNTVRASNINNAMAGKVAGVQVLSQSAAALGRETSVRIRGENGLGMGGGPVYVVDGTIMPGTSNSINGKGGGGGDINADDVDNITVLQGPAATALFGAEGANGAIVINSKKARRYYYGYNTPGEYKLSSCEDEEYVQEMNAAENYELWETFLKLERKNIKDVGFYFEMANIFFERGYSDKAQEIMYNAIELSRGSNAGLKLVAYTYEKWKWFDKAIAVYKGILSNNENNLMVRRDLALAYFQNKNFEAAVKTYYSIIIAPDETNSYSNLKDNSLAEMNAILALHKNELDISYINQNLIKILPVDLRITVESNYDHVRNVQFIDPGNIKYNALITNTANRGRFAGGYYSYNNDLSEYAIKKAESGKYRVKVDAHNSYSYAEQIPTFLRVITFKNFQKENMQMEAKLFDLDNQYGVVELDEINW